MGKKLLACETVSAVVVHLRVDDGVHIPNGGLRKPFLCGGTHMSLGLAWDKPNVPVPESPEKAREINRGLEHSRWCAACIAAWEKIDG